MLCGGKCYKMIKKNRGNEVILEMVEALKNKNFEFPRAHLENKRLRFREVMIVERRKLFVVQKIKIIDGLKGIAMLCIIMTHCTVRGIENSLFGTIVQTGARGVQLFFLISAFLAFASFGRKYGNMIFSVKDAVVWLIGKVIRLIPIYYLVLVVYLSLDGSGGGENVAW